MKRDCAKCANVHRIMQAAKVVGMECRLNPPMGFLATVADQQRTPANPEGLRQVPGSLWPPVQAGQYCGQFAPQADILKAD